MARLIYTAILTGLLCSYVTRVADDRRWQAALSRLDAERIAREGKTDREFYAAHPDHFVVRK
ncbi:hypothetical protein IVA80_15320 [Bradyrhizobium sp. 139]|uniref:hypothetical protein n=1 Tax=Bradyrhizobium sp. 139 TaxID=2782616 RepID=UPI001FF9A0A5|nr:hypothetical protein [Bradyrhizobium sp. 139]MCK1742194.1 hypothetical protein [Bradyrhizobium sp. 139]